MLLRCCWIYMYIYGFLIAQLEQKWWALIGWVEGSFIEGIAHIHDSTPSYVVGTRPPRSTTSKPANLQ